MPKPRRKKILLFISLLVILLLGFGYIFRYELILKFQYARLQSLQCAEKTIAGKGCLDRIWVHRVNSVQRYEALKDKFTGFETDIVYNNSSLSFSVFHPPLEPGDKDTLSLNDFFQSTDLQNKRFWLDTRFVGGSNMSDAVTALSEMVNADLIRKACIFELYDLGAAEYFTEQGYTVSFNVPVPLTEELKTNQLLRDSINKKLVNVKYVSQEASHLATLKNLFPGKQIITWDPHFSNFFNKDKLQQLLNDQQVAIILVNIKSRHYR